MKLVYSRQRRTFLISICHRIMIARDIVEENLEVFII